MADRRENKHLAYDKLSRDIAASNIGRLYVFHGEETYLRDHSLAAIRQKLVTAGTESFNYRVLEADASISYVEEAVDSFPMLSEKTLVVVKDCDLYHLPEAEQDRLIRLLKDLPEHCCLIFMYDALEFSSDKRRKIHAALTKSGEIVEFAGQEQARLVKWIQKHVRDCGRRISSENADYMMFLCGPLMNTLLGEIEKVCAYGRDEEISRQDLDAVITPRLEAGAFNLAGALLEGDTQKAESLLDQLLLMREEPVVILGAIGWQLRRVYTARLIRQKRGDENALMEIWPGLSFYQARRMLGSADGAGLKWCRRALTACADADYRLKSSGEDPRLTLDIMLLQLSNNE